MPVSLRQAQRPLGLQLRVATLELDGAAKTRLEQGAKPAFHATGHDHHPHHQADHGGWFSNFAHQLVEQTLQRVVRLGLTIALAPEC